MPHTTGGIYLKSYFFSLLRLNNDATIMSCDIQSFLISSLNDSSSYTASKFIKISFDSFIQYIDTLSKTEKGPRHRFCHFILQKFSAYHFKQQRTSRIVHGLLQRASGADVCVLIGWFIRRRKPKVIVLVRAASPIYILLYPCFL